MLYLPIPGFRKYMAREDGRILGQRGRLLSMSVGNHGYVCHNPVADGGVARSTTAHRMIAYAFLPRVGDPQVVRHLDGNKLNNSPINLAWGSHGDNRADDKRHGVTHAEPDLPASAQRRLLWRWRMLGENKDDLCAEFGISHRTIYNYWEKFIAAPTPTPFA